MQKSDEQRVRERTQEKKEKMKVGSYDQCFPVIHFLYRMEMREILGDCFVLVK